jgi:hypothetical protein
MRSFVLKTGATLLAVAATILSSVYVTAHLKNAAAPLQPPVLNANNGVTAFGGTVSVSPSVQPGSAQPVTSTYAS